MVSSLSSSSWEWCVESQREWNIFQKWTMSTVTWLHATSWSTAIWCVKCRTLGFHATYRKIRQIDHAEINSTILRSQTNTARVEGLRPGTVYVVQVRARTVAGFGKYSSKMCFQTLTDGKNRQARSNSSVSVLHTYTCTVFLSSLHIVC